MGCKQLPAITKQSSLFSKFHDTMLRMVTMTPLILKRIVSGGQTGADRAALDFAIEYGYPHGGWALRGRQAEDGPIPLKYQLTELTDGGYRQRNKRNVKDSDGTLIVNIGVLDGGTLATQAFAQKLKRPYFLAQLDTPPRIRRAACCRVVAHP